MGRRLKLLLVSRDLLVDLFRQDSSQRRLKMTGMPADARIVGVILSLPNATCSDIALKVESEEFPETVEGHQLQEFDVFTSICHVTPAGTNAEPVAVVREHDGSCWRAITEEEYLSLTGWEKESLFTPTSLKELKEIVDERYAITLNELRALRGRKPYKLPEESKGEEMLVPDYANDTITVSPQTFEAYEKSSLYCKCSTETLVATGCTCGGS